MSVFMVLFFLGVSAIVLIMLLKTITKLNEGSSKTLSKKQRAALEQQRKNAQAKGLLVNCPLCNSPLLPGEDLFTRVYRPMNVSDQLCTISGCPHCFPKTEPGVLRNCPVCHKEVPLSGHLIARLFNKTVGKKHVIVTGCNQCCRSGK